MTGVIADDSSQATNNQVMELEQIDSLCESYPSDMTLQERRSVILTGETKLQAEEQMFFQASLLEQICQAVIATDLKGEIIYWNSYATTLYQWQAAEVMGKNIYEVIVPQINERQLEEMEDSIANAGEWKGEFFVRRRDGSKFWTQVTNSAIQDAKGKIIGIVGVSIDATEQQQVEEALRQSETKNKILFNAIPDAIFRIGKDGTLLDFKAAKDFEPELVLSKFLGQKISELLSFEVAQIAMEKLNTSLSTGEMQTYNYQWHKNGKSHYFEARIVPSNEREVMAIVRDVTEGKQAEAQLAKSEERYRVVSELISDFAYAARVDITGNLVIDWTTGAFSRICGFTDEEIEANGGWQTLIYPEDLPIFQHRLQNLLYWQSDVSEYRIITKEGQIRWLRDYSQPVDCEQEDRVLVIYGAAQDITERKQAEEALRQQTERERLLALMQERIRQSLNLDEILAQAVAEIRNFLQVERVAIYQIDLEREGKFVVESVAPSCTSIAGMSLVDPCFDENYAYKYQQGQVSAVEDIYQANLSNCHIELLARLDIRANLLVPITIGEQGTNLASQPNQQARLWGMLCAHQCTGTRNWQPFEIELLQQLAAKVAIAIQQSELYRQIQKLNTDLERQVQERTKELQKALEFEAILRRITNEVRDSLDENQILQTAVRELAVGLSMNSCNAALYDLEADTATICFEYAVSIPASQGRVAQITNFPEIYNQLLQKQYFQFCSLLPHPVQGRRARLACPIFDNEGTIGDLWLVNNSEYAFSELETRLAQQVANQCAIAIRQARLYQAAQAQVAELEKLNRLKDDFLSTVSHELRTPMSNIKMAIQMLKIAPAGDRRQRYLEILQTECNRETELINDLLDLQRLEAQSYPLLLGEAIDLKEWVPGIMEPFYSRAQDHQQILQLELPTNLSPLISDRAGLARILAELLNNACKYTPAGSAIVLRVTQYLNSDRPSGKRSRGDARFNCTTPESPESSSLTTITVSNQAEIPAKELPHLFEKFYRVPKADLWKQGGTGLGLALVQKLVEQMRGNIEVESCNGWTRFRIDLPTNPLMANG